MVAKKIKKTAIETVLPRQDASKKKRTWSKFQQAIFEDISEGKGHTVVIARAGSGKTSTIVKGFEYVPNGKSVIMMAFNTSIKDELMDRAPNGVDVSTLHSYGMKQIGSQFGRVRVDKDKMRRIVESLVGATRDTWEQRKSIEKAVGLAKGNLASTAEEIDEIIDQHQIVPPETAAERPRFIENVLKAMELAKAQKEVIDFDDMIWFPNVFEMKCRQYDRVFVDETQDLNKAQIQLALKACKKNGRICAVGDDKQAIYGFRGADSNAITNIVTALGAKVLPLSVTYRCAKSIVVLAQTVVPDLEAFEHADEGKVESVDIVRLKLEAQAGDFILSRVNAPLISLCMAFLRENRRANIQGRDIGSKLAGMVKRAQAESVQELIAHVEQWRDVEITRLEQQGRSVTSIEDTADCLLTLCDGAKSVQHVVESIESLFADGDDRNRIILSSTHKAKGLERERVWLLKSTYMRPPPKGKSQSEAQAREESNLYYVAVTRAKKELFLVEGALR